jgi:hypothetical protein
MELKILRYTIASLKQSSTSACIQISSTGRKTYWYCALIAISPKKFQDYQRMNFVNYSELSRGVSWGDLCEC